MSLDQLRQPVREPARPFQPADYRRRLQRSDLLVAASWVSVAITLALYLADGTPPGFATRADAATTLGVIAGLIGTDLVLVMLVLAARVPLIDHTFGHDKAMLAHRRIAKPAFYLLIAHGVLLLVGYGSASGVNPVAEIVVMWNTLPDMPLAFAAFIGFSIVVVSSLVAVRRRFPYELWHAIHLLSYVAVLSALPHQLSVGGLFTAGSVQRFYWLALYVIVAGLLVVYRFALPLYRSLRHGIRVSSVTHIAPEVVTIELAGRALHLLRASGGQFFVWRFWTAGTWWHAHPLSLSSAPDPNTLKVTVRALGSGSADLARVRPGTRVSIEGPYGIFTQLSRTSERIVLVAAGIGITPVIALLEDAALRPREATVIVRAPDNVPPYLWDELVAACGRKGATLFVDRGERSREVASWQSARAVDQGFRLTSYAPELRHSDLYICGPAAWADLVSAEARTSGMRRDQLHVERFDW